MSPEDTEDLDEDSEWEGLGEPAATIIQIPFNGQNIGGGLELHIGAKLTLKQRAAVLRSVTKTVGRELGTILAGWDRR